MLLKFRYYLSVLFFMARMSVRKQLAYPLYIISCLLMIPMMVATGILLLYALAASFGSVSGWRFEELAFLYGLGYLSHGLMMVFGAQNIWMDLTVIRGDFDRMLLRPLSVFAQFSVTYFNLIGLMDVLLGGCVLFYSASQLGLVWTVFSLLQLALVLLGATLIRSAVFTIACSSAFWTRRSGALFWLLTDLMERTTMLPLSIYPIAFQLTLSLVVPLAFISFYPACSWLGKTTALALPWPATLITLVIGVTLSWVAIRFFNYGLKKYESAGS